MSAADVTRAAFASGVSPTTWAKLVRTATGGAPYHGALYGPEICETILSLLSLYTTSPPLLSYLALSLGLPPSAPQDLTTTYARTTDTPLIPLYVYVRTLITTLGAFPSRLPLSLAEPLCRLALLANEAYTSPVLSSLPPSPNPLLPPAASPLPLIPPFVVLLSALSSSLPQPPPTAPPELLLHTLALLQPEHQIPLLTPSEKAQILAAVDQSRSWSDVFSIAGKGLQRVEWLIRMWEQGGGDPVAGMMGGVGGMWGGMGMGMGGIGGDALGVVGQGQGQPMTAERDKVGPSLPLMSLILSNLVEHRSTPFGSSSTSVALSLLQLLYPTPSAPSSSSLQTELQSSFSALLQAAISLIALHPYPAPTSPTISSPATAEALTQQSDRAVLYRSFVLGRLPALLSPLPDFPHPHPNPPSSSTEDDPPQGEAAKAIELALEQLFREWKEVLDSCNPPSTAGHAGAGGGLGSDGVDDEARPPSFRLDLLRALVSASLLTPTAAQRICPSYTPLDPPLTIEAAENMLPPSSYLEDRLSSASSEDALAFLSRMEADWHAHQLLATWFSDRFAQASKAGSLEQLSSACRLLSSHPLALDLVSLWVPLGELVQAAGEFLEGFDLEGVDDPQSALGRWGEVVLWCQFVGERYELTIPDDPDTLSPPSWAALLTPSTQPTPLRLLSPADRTLLSRWLSALFSPAEGIDDPMLRSTSPHSLLRLSTTFFEQAILARSLGVIDGETMQNGVGYFLSGLLSWTLVGVVRWLAGEAERQGPYSSLHFEILQMILLSESCPPPVLAVTGAGVLRLLTNTRLVMAMQAGGVNVQGIREVVNKSLGTGEDPFTDTNGQHTLPAWSDNCQSAVREAFTQAHLNKVTTLDADRYLSILRPKEFVHILWDACLSGASMGATDGCRVVTAFLLSGLRSPSSPPLLPYFLLVFVPSLLSDMDRQSPQQASATMDTLVTVIVSACHLSFQLERSFLKIADGAPLSIELRSRLQPRIWLNALLDRLETAPGSSSRLLSKRLHVVLND